MAEWSKALVWSTSVSKGTQGSNPCPSENILQPRSGGENSGLKNNTMNIHKSIKKALGYKLHTSNKEVLNDWKKRVSRLCKPCWELKYCPYGPVVEDFPLVPVIKNEAVDHNNYLKECIKTGKLGSGDKLDAERKKWFKREIASFNSKDYPKSIPKIFLEASCKVFGHICPVFFVAEPLTETKERRRHNRSIPREVMLKVARRDGQICQKCNKPVMDNEVEFDHLIPYSRGGESTEKNLRLVHRDCNRKKSSSLNEILHPSPIEHLFDIRKRKK